MTKRYVLVAFAALAFLAGACGSGDDNSLSGAAMQTTTTCLKKDEKLCDAQAKATTTTANPKAKCAPDDKKCALASDQAPKTTTTTAKANAKCAPDDKKCELAMEQAAKTTTTLPPKGLKPVCQTTTTTIGKTKTDPKTTTTIGKMKTDPKTTTTTTCTPAKK